MNLGMRRLVVTIAGVLLLSAGPVLPSFHLATSPHRYCVTHRAFETAPSHPDHPQDPAEPNKPGDQPEQHETCLLATLLLQLVHPSPQVALSDERPAPYVDRPATLIRTPMQPRLHVVFLAPKNSPPGPAQA